MSAEEFYKQEKKAGTYKQGFCGWDMIKFAEAYHKSKVEAEIGRLEDIEDYYEISLTKRIKALQRLLKQ